MGHDQRHLHGAGRVYLGSGAVAGPTGAVELEERG